MAVVPEQHKGILVLALAESGRLILLSGKSRRLNTVIQGALSAGRLMYPAPFQ